MTRIQMDWASAHDWFVCASQQDEHSIDWAVTVIERGLTLDVNTGKDEPYAEKYNFKSVLELRHWAGYRQTVVAKP